VRSVEQLEKETRLILQRFVLVVALESSIYSEYFMH
jgi:hypothetical protein